MRGEVWEGASRLVTFRVLSSLRAGRLVGNRGVAVVGRSSRDLLSSDLLSLSVVSEELLDSVDRSERGFELAFEGETGTGCFTGSGSPL